MSLQGTNTEDILQGNFPSTGITEYPKPRKFDSNDLFIAVMGVTGSGKSTFIAKCTGQAVAVGHGLESHTSEIEIYSFQYNDKRIHLIDTPGFDDTYKPDIEVLKTAATWLSEAYQKDLLLTGIIYLHRITDPKMGGTARKDLMMFKKLCGEDSFSNVVLATTHWENVSAEDGDRREAELRASTEFYGAMIRRGSTMMRHMDNAISARAVVAHLVNQHTTTVLNIQREMVADKVGLKETEAGRVLQSDIIKRTEQLNRKLKDTEDKMREAIRQKNDALAKELAEQQQELNELKAAAQRGVEQLDVKIEDLFREKDEKFKKAMKELEDERKMRERVIREKTKEHKIFKRKIRAAEQQAERKRKSTEQEIENKKKELDQATDDNYKLLAAFLQTTMQKEEDDRKVREEKLARAWEEIEKQRADIQAAYTRMQQALVQQAHRPEFYQADPPPPYQQQAWQPQPPRPQMCQPYQQDLDPAMVGLGAIGGVAMGAAAAGMCNVM